MDRILFRSRAKPTLQNVSHFRSILDTVCRATGATADIVNRLTTCYSELATNVVEHSDPAASWFAIEIGQSQLNWWIHIQDDGGHAELPDNIDPLEIDPEHESGRGLMIIQAMADAFTHHLDDAGVYHNRVDVLRQHNDQLDAILIVEDDAALRALYSQYLQDSYRVLSAIDAHEALKVLRQDSTVQAVISDIKMPKIDGIRFRELMLTDEDQELLPFIFISGVNDSDTVNQANQMMIDAFLTKPVSATTLRNTLNNTILRKKQLTARLNKRILKQLSGVHPANIQLSPQHYQMALGTRSPGQGGADFVIEHCQDGDYYLVLADVMGHNEAAKFFAFSYAGFLKGLFAGMQVPLAPGVIMQQLSAAVSQNDLLRASMLTCCILRLKSTGDVEYCTAGHPPLLHQHDGQIEMLETGGCLPGLLDDEAYVSQSIQLGRDERLFALTDGLFESASTQPARDQLETRIMQAITQSQNQTLQQCVDTTLARFDEYSDKQAQDDVTLLAIQSNLSPFSEPST